MSRIEIQISPSVTPEQRQNSRFIKLFRDAERFFNCLCAKCARYRRLIALHEVGHAYFAKMAGSTNIKCYGPTMYWDSRIDPKTSLPYDCPAISRSSVSWETDASVPFIDAIKANVAGYVCRREMSELPNDQHAVDFDLESALNWYQRNGNRTEDFQGLVKQAEEAIMRDLQSRGVKDEIWEEAKRFEKEIFPVKLTSSLLRTRRLGQTVGCTAR